MSKFEHGSMDAAEALETEGYEGLLDIINGKHSDPGDFAVAKAVKRAGVMMAFYNDGHSDQGNGLNYAHLIPKGWRRVAYKEGWRASAFAAK